MSFCKCKEFFQSRLENSEDPLIVDNGSSSTLSDEITLSKQTTCNTRWTFWTIPLFLSVHNTDGQMPIHMYYVFSTGGSSLSYMNLDADRLIAKWLNLPEMIATKKDEFPITHFWIQPNANELLGSGLVISLYFGNYGSKVVSTITTVQRQPVVDTDFNDGLLYVQYRTRMYVPSPNPVFLGYRTMPLFLMITAENLSNEDFQFDIQFYRNKQLIHLTSDNTSVIASQWSKHTVVISLDEELIQEESDLCEFVNGLASNNLTDSNYPWSSTLGKHRYGITETTDLFVHFDRTVSISYIDFNMSYGNWALKYS